MTKVNDELVSIIVPVYNVEKYVKKSVMSILRQEYENIEVIIVNDGSTDNSGVICDGIAKNDARVRVLHFIENRGLSSARNLGLKEAKGRYIAFVDSDDLIHPQMISLLLENLRRNDADISVCNYLTIDENRETCDEKINPNGWDEMLYTKDNLYDILYIESRYGVVVWNKLYKREMLQDITFPVGKTHEDNFMMHHILSHASKICASYIPLYFYRIRQKSVTSVCNIDSYLEDMEACQDRIDFFINSHNSYYMNKAICELLSRIITAYYRLSRLKTPNKDIDILIKLYKHNYSMLDRRQLSFKNKVQYDSFFSMPFLGARLQHIVINKKGR